MNNRPNFKTVNAGDDAKRATLEAADTIETAPDETVKSVKPVPQIQPDRDEQIRIAAYIMAERRGFAPGFEAEDWLAAEQEVDAALAPHAESGES